MQTRRGSICEKLADLASGMILSWIIQAYVLYPAMGLTISGNQNIIIVGALTLVSFVRGYFWRRLFNSLENSDAD